MTRVVLIALCSGALAFVLTLSRSSIPWLAAIAAVAVLRWLRH